MLFNGLSVEIHQLLTHDLPTAALDLLESCGGEGCTFGVIADEINCVITQLGQISWGVKPARPGGIHEIHWAAAPGGNDGDP